MGKRLYFSPEEQLRLKVFLEQIEDFLFRQKASFLCFQLARTRVHELALSLSTLSRIRNVVGEFISATEQYPPSAGLDEVRRILEDIRVNCRMEEVTFRIREQGKDPVNEPAIS